MIQVCFAPQFRFDVFRSERFNTHFIPHFKRKKCYKVKLSPAFTNRDDNLFKSFKNPWASMHSPLTGKF